jgi:hypothetical protein
MTHIARQIKDTKTLPIPKYRFYKAILAVEINAQNMTRQIILGASFVIGFIRRFPCYLLRLSPTLLC